jgi:hypothetical protein
MWAFIGILSWRSSLWSWACSYQVGVVAVGITLVGFLFNCYYVNWKYCQPEVNQAVVTDTYIQVRGMMQKGGFT